VPQFKLLIFGWPVFLGISDYRAVLRTTKFGILGLLSADEFKLVNRQEVIRCGNVQIVAHATLKQHSFVSAVAHHYKINQKCQLAPNVANRFRRRGGFVSIVGIN